MSLELENINLGATAGDKTGDGARTGGGKINRNFEKIKNFLEAPDAILVQTGYELSGQNLTFNSGWKWRIATVEYTNPSDVVINFPLAAAGKSRLDVVVLTTSNTFLRVAGVESTSTPVAPSAPSGSLYVTVVLITDGAVNEPEQPEVNGAYVQKSERANVYLTGSGVINQLDLVDDKATIVFKGSITRLNTISYASVPYNGKRITLFNAQATPVTIGYSVSGYGVDFVFSDEQDYILKPNETIEFSFDITYAPYAHHMLIGDSFVLRTFGDQTKEGVLTTYGNTVTDGTYIFKTSLLPIRNNLGDFFQQPFFQSDKGYFIFQPLDADTPARFYIMPKGILAALGAKFEIFNNDYSDDYTQYEAFNILLNNTTNQIDIGPNRGSGGGSRQKMRLGGDYVGSGFTANASAIDFNIDNTLNLNPFNGAVTFGTNNSDPYTLGLENQYTFRNPATGQPTRVNINGNGSSAGALYFGRDNVRAANIGMSGATNVLDISVNKTNSGNTLTTYFKILGNTGNLLLADGGSFVDNNRGRLQVNGNITASPATESDQVVVKSQLDAAMSGGSFVPILTAGTNTTSPSLIRAFFTRSGNIIRGSITFSVTITAANAHSTVGFTLPVNKTTNSSIAFGTGVVNSSVQYASGIATFTSSINAATFEFYSSANGTRMVNIQFEYSVNE